MTSGEDKIKKIKIIPSKFSDHNPLKLEIDCEKEVLKKHKSVEIKEHTTKEGLGQRRNKR